MSWVQLAKPDGQIVWVNLERVDLILDQGGEGALVGFGGGTWLPVQEPLVEIQRRAEAGR